MIARKFAPGRTPRRTLDDWLTPASTIALALILALFAIFVAHLAIQVTTAGCGAC